jgi:hypothetical protein
MNPISLRASGAFTLSFRGEPPLAHLLPRTAQLLTLWFSAGLLLASSLGAQTTWTGASSTNWAVAANWSAGVPTASVHAIIPNVTNAPVIQAGTAAVANSVFVDNNGSLTIQTTGSLTINGSFVHTSGESSGFRNQGTVSNSGLLVLGSTGAVGNFGLMNRGTFNNNSGAEIRIDRASIVGLWNWMPGTFTNAAKITIGTISNLTNYGLQNDGPFDNISGGEIRIDHSSIVGLWARSGTFTNGAKIIIGASATVGNTGLRNEASFNNTPGGEISIDRCSTIGLWNRSGTFTNAAKIIIGANQSVGVDGLFNQGTFNNNSGGEISIDRTTRFGLFNEAGAFTNAAKIIIGASATVGDTGLRNEASFNNNPGGEISMDRSSTIGFWNRSGTFTNAAKITIGANQSVGVDGLFNQGTFNNNSGGEISIDRTTRFGLFNEAGAFTNAAKITIGAIAAIGDSGLRNEAIFNNNPGGEISMDRCSNHGLWNRSGTFTNAAKITLGANLNVGVDGLFNQGTFNNNSGGEIRIDRTTRFGLLNEAGAFTNAAKIIIGPTATVGESGLRNEAIFNNNPGGEISIDRSSTIGLWNRSGTFTNAAKITLGANQSVGVNGLFNEGAFNNNSGGEISIDRALIIGIRNLGTFGNTAKITIGANSSVGTYSIFNAATFQNNACAHLYQYFPLFNTTNFSNSGLMLVSTSGTHENTAGLTNNGIIAYPLGNPIPNVTNNEIIIAPTASDDCQSVSPAFALGSPVDFTIVGIFTDAAATISAGAYNTATNTFTPTAELPEDTYNYFVKIQDGMGGCTRIVPWQLTTADCCDAPEALCKPATIYLDAEGQATLTVAEVDNGSTADCGLLSITLSANQFDCSQAGPQSVTLTITDLRNASSQCMATVTVVDSIKPTISCPATQTLILGANCTASLPDYTGMAANVGDNCGVQGVTQSPVAGTIVSGTGPMTVLLTVADINGLTDTCSFTVDKVDDTPPSLTCRTATIYLNPTGNYSLLDTDVLDFDASTDNCSAITVTHISPSDFDCGDLMQAFDVLVTAQDDSGNSSQCIASITVFEGTALPQPWAGADVGNPSAGNTYEYSPCSQPPVYTVQAGAANNSQTGDNLATIAQTLCGDFSIEVKIEAVTPNGWAGLMVRESSNPGSKMVGMYSNLGSIVRWESRQINNAPKSINLFSRPFPSWLRLVRQGNLFIGYYSVNGSSYSIVNIQNIPLGSCLEVGVAAFTTISGQLATAVFSNLAVSGGVVPSSIAPGYTLEPAEAERQASPRLWPNPAREAFTLELPAAAAEARLRLLNQLGQPLEERLLPAGESQLEWGIHHLPAGVYFVEVQADSPAEDGRRAILRLVKAE